MLVPASATVASTAAIDATEAASSSGDMQASAESFDDGVDDL